MVSDFEYFIIYFFVIIASIGLAEVVRRFMRWSAEATRKIVHILVGVFVATTPFVLRSTWPMILLGTLFILINYWDVKRKVFRGMHGLERLSYGTVFYPISFVVLVLLFWKSDPLIFILATLLMAIPDAIAAIVGEGASNPIDLPTGLERKTLQGSTAMFLSSWLLVFPGFLLFPRFLPLPINVLTMLWFAILVAVFATACEAVSVHGSDNLTVPLGSAFVLHYLLHATTTNAVAFSIGVLLALFVAALSLKLRFLDGGGAVGTFLLGAVVFGVGRWSFGAPILAFFILSSLLSRMGRRRKKTLEGLFEKTGRRDFWQVYANGGLPGLLVLAWYVRPHPAVYVMFIAALAAVTADTWGTEIGTLSKRNPVLITNFQPVSPGTSGAVTLMGTVGAFAGALILALFGYAFRPIQLPEFFKLPEIVLVFSAGLVGSLVDSVLGATVQAIYRCPVCHKMTEKRIHCPGQPAVLVRGYRWVNNDTVNFFAALSGAVFALLLWFAVN